MRRQRQPLSPLVAILLFPWTALAQPASKPLFTDRAADVGLDFVHFNGMSGEFYFSEIVGAGGALFDYDGDGDLDVYLVQGHMLGPGKTVADAATPPKGELRGRLFRNDLSEGAGLRFTEVTEESGLRALGYGMGVATGDYDNDGRLDLYLTNFGPNQLWRNQGPGAGGETTFRDVTLETGVDDVRWSIPATFVDYDRDGWLDLFVGNYVEFTITGHRPCFTMAGAPDYCGPHAYKPEPDRLFRNAGRGAGGKVTFEDVTSRSGILSDYGSGLGVTAADFEGNGWPDLYVGNDGMPNQMWTNLGDGRFRNDALLAGTGVNHMGKAEASMGVTVADFDSDGDEDIFVTHLVRETNTLYRNDGSGLFEDYGDDVGLGAPSWPYTGFGTVWLDYDNDGWLDLLVANGEVKVIPELEARGDPHPLHQPNQLFHNRGPGAAGKVTFEDATAAAGPAFELSEVSRGVAAGDVDEDGDLDVLLVNNNGPVRLLINEVGQDAHWVGLRLVGGDKSPRDMLGARAGVFRAGRPILWRRVSTGGSFLSASDPRLLIGLGDAPAIERVVVEWPDGGKEQWRVEADRYTVLRQGSGAPVE
jgi:hypothetical protein